MKKWLILSFLVIVVCQKTCAQFSGYDASQALIMIPITSASGQQQYMSNTCTTGIKTYGLACVIGAVEVFNPVALVWGVAFPLSLYALEYYKTDVLSHKMSNEDDDEDSDDEDNEAIDKQLYLCNPEVLYKTYSYYKVTRRALYTLYQDLMQMKNDIVCIVNPNYGGMSNFSVKLLSYYQSALLNITSPAYTSFAHIAYEASLSVVQQEQLMRARDAELAQLQLAICDVHLLLAFHVSELVNRKNKAIEALDRVRLNGEKENVHSGGQSLYTCFDSIVFHRYTMCFIEQELCIDGERKIKELDAVNAYYHEAHNFFIEKTTNLKQVFSEHARINKTLTANIIQIKKDMGVQRLWCERYLKTRGIFSQKFMIGVHNYAQKFCFNKEDEEVAQAQKKQELIKDAMHKELDKQKMGSLSGKDPDAASNFFVALKKRSDKKLHSQRFGTFFRDPHSGLWWSKYTPGCTTYFKVFKEGAEGLEWTFDANKSGRQIAVQDAEAKKVSIPYCELLCI